MGQTEILKFLEKCKRLGKEPQNHKQMAKATNVTESTLSNTLVGMRDRREVRYKEEKRCGRNFRYVYYLD